MNSLIIDTSTKYLYIALVQDDKVLSERTFEGSKNHAGNSVYQIDLLLKEFGLNTIVTSIEKNIKEAQKCILVCPICHRKIHYNIITDIPSPSIDVDLFWKHYDILSPQGKHQREIMQNKKPTREELKELIRKQTFTSIAERYNVSIAAIKKWCIKFNLPYQKKVIKTINDADWLSI